MHQNEFNVNRMIDLLAVPSPRRDAVPINEEEEDESENPRNQSYRLNIQPPDALLQRRGNR